MEERVKAKARLACRLRARETRPSTTTSTFTALPVSNGDQNGSSNSNEVSNDNYSSNNNDNCNDDNESTVKEDGSGTIVCDNGDTVCADNTNQNLYESQASPPHHSHTLTHPFSPPPPPDLSGPNTVSSLPHSQSIPSPHPPHDVEKNSDQRIELTKVGNDSHLSPTQSDLICIPRMIYEIFSPESPHSPLSSLFVTHAQYKFIYKIACELTKD